MAVQDLARIEDKLDKVSVSSIAISDSVGGVIITNLAEVMKFSDALSRTGTAVPKHLRNNPGGCFAIAMQALEWRMSPLAVANKSYEVNDRIAYESQLIHAVIEARAPLKNRLRCRYEGEGDQRQCIVAGHIKGEVDPLEYRSPPIAKINPKNSPLWKNDPDQQLWYFSSRAWCRRFCPDVLLGIYSKDELEDSEIGADRAKDITPKPDVGTRLKGKKKDTGFQPAQIEQTISGVSAAESGGGRQPLEQIIEATGKIEPKNITQKIPASAEQSATPAADVANDDKPETSMQRGIRLLEKCKTMAEVTDLHDTIADELDGDAERSAWRQYADTRRKELAKS